MPPIQPARGERMGLNSLSCVTLSLGSALSRLRSGARGPQDVVRLTAGTFEFNHQNLAFRQQFSALVTTNFLELSHVDDPFSLHRKPAFDSVTAPTQRAIYVRRNRCGHLVYVRGAVGSHAPPGALSGEGVRAPSPLPSEAPQKRKASGAYHDANQRRFPESSHAVQTIFSGAKFLCFSQLSRIIH